MHRRPRALVSLAAISLVAALGLGACGDTESPAEAATMVVDAHRSQVSDQADESTTTTTAPPTTTTTVAPTTTTPPAPVTTPPAPARRTTTPVTAAPAPKPAVSPCTEAGLLASINGQRAQHGLSALTLRGGATSVACSWSAHMASSGLAHNPRLSADLAAHGVSGWAATGENVGYGSSASQVFGLFMGSSGHRDNILNAAYDQVGIGVVRSGSRLWVTFDFVGF